ncbi:MAG: hypothetical protein IPI83_13460 [Sphingomonadales bacterium]|nr:hypothetical protein [Sphingomonadales bacterium]
MGIVLLTGVRLTHPLMAAPARARQGQHSGRIAHPSGETRLGGLARAGLEPKGPRPTRARPSRVAQDWRLAQGLSRMATDHECKSKLRQGGQDGSPRPVLAHQAARLG